MRRRLINLMLLLTLTACGGGGGGASPPPPVDTTPEPFAFTSLTGVPINTVQTSNAVTIAGINSAAPISVAGGTYSIGCSGSFTASSDTITNGQTVCVQHTSSSSFDTTTTTTLTVGGVSADFSSTTAAADTTPDPYAFTSLTGVPINTVQTSNTVTISGINTSASISVSGGTYAIGCSGSFTASPGTITNGQTVCVRHTSSSSWATTTTTTLTIGGVSAGFSSTTPPQTARCSDPAAVALPFKAGSERLSAYGAGAAYEDVFLAGVNLGVAVPGTFAGELAATREQYDSWLQKMGDAGINAVRVYTLHYPRFYDALAAYNTQRESAGKAPIYLFQGVWLDDQYADPGTKGLYDPTLTATFEQGMREDVDAVHGNANIDPRFGRAYGTYTTDVSCWVMGYIIGREVFPGEITTTNTNNASTTHFTGTALSLPTGTPSEAWVTAQLDYLVNYERDTYSTQRPVSFSSWPTLDPLAHNIYDPDDTEDDESLDLANISLADAPAGVFYTYHAYPYFPDFVSETASYRAYSDSEGPNSYVGYLTDLKAHYANRPLVVGEFGVPSSWGDIHIAHSHMDHGGHTEEAQGDYAARMLLNLHDAQTAGGMLFAWIDEWWKSTWLTNPWDFPAERRAYWHNILAPEQNFGLIRFDPAVSAETSYVLSGGTPTEITAASASYDSRALHLRLTLASPLATSDEVVLGIDTYDTSSVVGEHTLNPNGLVHTPVTTAQGSEFALRLHHDGTHWQASYSVTPAYDLRGLSHDELVAAQKLQSTNTTGAGWNLMSWKNNFSLFPSPSTTDTFYGHPENTEYAIGSLLDVREPADAATNRDIVEISSTELLVHIPWGLLQVTDPSQQQVFHGDPGPPPALATRTTTGVALAVVYNDVLQGETNRYLWNKWLCPPADPPCDPMPAVTEHDKAALAKYGAGIAAVPTP